LVRVQTPAPASPSAKNVIRGHRDAVARNRSRNEATLFLKANRNAAHRVYGVRCLAKAEKNQSQSKQTMMLLGKRVVEGNAVTFSQKKKSGLDHLLNRRTQPKIRTGEKKVIHDPNRNEKTHPQLFIIEDHADDCEQSLPQVRRPELLNPQDA